ncbi:hypothetical protein ASPZODRAFT_541535 [Penicilliopsis zonata CBS 506.65]|uniref:Uncharacterized protein n=1 Tax=Penicilliopsis zonata CBS 506.65 TaxID=1073090 RepID=A0A1L9SFR5_9EURO|nr:hypothetical protein ASPZODRAFT_541535 [Penicilliopsis zonata CBS 506.65]OJJ45864.1 hypothetical protein ASPZODRAFT_541535 [Penicilliopsis zonata CBS 506.65]
MKWKWSHLWSRVAFFSCPQPIRQRLQHLSLDSPSLIMIILTLYRLTSDEKKAPSVLRSFKPMKADSSPCFQQPIGATHKSGGYNKKKSKKRSTRICPLPPFRSAWLGKQGMSYLEYYLVASVPSCRNPARWDPTDRPNILREIKFLRQRCCPSLDHGALDAVES